MNNFQVRCQLDAVLGIRYRLGIIITENYHTKLDTLVLFWFDGRKMSISEPRCQI